MGAGVEARVNIGIGGLLTSWLGLLVALVITSTLSGSMIRTLRGGEGLPKMFYFSRIEPGASPQPVLD